MNPENCGAFKTHVSRVLVVFLTGKGEVPQTPEAFTYFEHSEFESCVRFVEATIHVPELSLQVYPETVKTMRRMGYTIVLSETIEPDDVLAYGRFEPSDDPGVKEEGYPFQGLDFHAFHLSVANDHSAVSAFGSLPRRIMFVYEHQIDAVPFTQEYVTHMIVFRRMQEDNTKIAS